MDTGIRRPLVYTPDEAARLLKVSSATIRKMVRAGKLPSIEGLGSSIRIPSRAVFELAGETPPAITEGLVAEGSWPQGDEDHAARRPLGRSHVTLGSTTRARLGAGRPRGATKPQAPVRIGDQGYWLLADSAKDRVMTWHLGIEAAMCGRQPEGKWSKSEKRGPHATLCPVCLTTVSQMPGIAFDTLPMNATVAMIKQMRRGDSVALRKAGWHTGDGRKTHCGRSDGPWQLTERLLDPRQECFECREYGRWLDDHNPHSIGYEGRNDARWSMLLDTDIDSAPLVALASKVPRFVVLRRSSRRVVPEDLTADWGNAATELFRDGTHLADGLIRSWHFHPGFFVTDNQELLELPEPRRSRTPQAALDWLEPWVADEQRSRSLRAKWDRERGKKPSR